MATKKKAAAPAPAPELSLEQPQIKDVPPQPVPMTFRIAQAHDGQGGFLVQLIAFTPTGQTVWFLDPGLALSLSEALIKVAEVSSTGLLLPGAGA